MSSKEQTHNDRTSSKQRSPKPVSEDLDTLAQQQPRPAAIIQRASRDPSSLTPRDVLQLQRAVGNRAVTQLLAKSSGQPRPVVQAKLMVGPAGDSYEQEADRVAEQIVDSQPPAVSHPPSTLSRQPEEEELQAKPLASTITPLLQRQAEEEEELQAKPDPLGGFEAGSDVESRLAARKGGGSPLPDETREFMEPRFGADFGGVRVHADGEAAQINRELSAQAFTHGQDIYMGEGRYNPGTDAGKRLLAHELTHVVQQTGHVQRVEPDKGGTPTEAPASGQLQGTIGNRNTRQLLTGTRQRQSPLSDEEELRTERTRHLMSIVQQGQAGQRATQARNSPGNTNYGSENTVDIVARTSKTQIQRLIVNVGEDSIPTELAKPEGWIIASDIEIALREGGVSQNLIELNRLQESSDLLSKDEDIYLVGHGAPGFVGDKLPGDVAHQLNLVLPEGYTGKIRSLSCSTGAVPSSDWKTGVKGMAENLKIRGITVSGAAGIALNHSAFEGGTRVIKPGDSHREAVFGEIARTRAAVDNAWKEYVTKNGVDVGMYMTAPLMADAISRPFYEQLEKNIEGNLLPKGGDITEEVS
jgi:hypothetical protein